MLRCHSATLLKILESRGYDTAGKGVETSFPYLIIQSCQIYNQNSGLNHFFLSMSKNVTLPFSQPHSQHEVIPPSPTKQPTFPAVDTRRHPAYHSQRITLPQNPRHRPVRSPYLFRSRCAASCLHLRISSQAPRYKQQQNALSLSLAPSTRHVRPRVATCLSTLR